ncbi:MFS transporter [Sphingomonas sp. PL-96]|uniref:MFS transporter n=1 Tax=Sphingomonas sp. PL-96 TaxID=2887201 RepID=UPI001E37B9A7|nr:MFS transporter [Sphingomonas sp. PL-96]MCC2978038.1 MFS transporter [Sphingomonas sp. PL-96]
MRVLYLAVGLLVSAAAGLGNALVSANLPQIQGELGLTPVEGAWLPAAYVMTNISANLILMKARQQFGMRTFAEWGIVAYLAVTGLYLIVSGYHAAVLVRAVAGFASAPLSTLAIFYVLQAFPKAKLGQGICIALGISQIWTPVAWMLSSPLLDLGDWQTLYLFEFGLAACALAAVISVKLPPGIRIQVFEAKDFLTFALLAPAMAIVGAVLAQGRTQWWTEQPWMGVALIVALVLFTLTWLIEHHRTNPLVMTRWLASQDAVRFMIGAFLMRMLLSEQNFAAVGLLRQLGMGPDQLQLFYLIMLLGIATGTAISALTFKPKALPLQILSAVVLVIIGSLLDRDATSMTRPHDMMLSQFLIAAAAGLFMAPLLIITVMKALGRGADHIVTYAVLFSATQALGGLAGPAVYGTFQQVREHEYSGQITANLVPSDPVVAQRLAIQGQVYAPVITDPVRRQAQGVALLAQTATREAHVRAYNDVFTLNAIIASLFLLYGVGLVAVAARKAKQNPKPAGASAGAAAV